MASIVIRSDEANAVTTALLLAARNHSVCLLNSSVAAGDHQFSYFGEHRTVRLFREAEMDVQAPRVGIVFAEGESVQPGVRSVLGSGRPDLLVIVGGGISGAVEAAETARDLDFEASRILLVGGFLAGGSADSVTVEKQGVLAGFLATGTPSQVLDLARETFPQVSIDDGASVALSSVNALIHVPPMILNAMSIERGDDVRFYVEGFGDSVCRLIAALDADRLVLGAAVGSVLLPLEELLDRYNGPAGMQGQTLREKVNGFLPYHSVKVPSSFRHRFLDHELRSTFAPMAELASAVGVNVPTIRSIVRLGEVLLDTDLTSESRLVARKFHALTTAN